MSGCANHASREAVGACVTCGKLVCEACNNEVDGKSYCPSCLNKAFTPQQPEEKPAAVATGAATASGTTVKRGINPVWWLAPVLLAIIGGLMAWLINREQDARTAVNMLVTGIGMSLLQGLLAAILIFALCVPSAGKTVIKSPSPTPNVPAATQGNASAKPSTAPGQAVTGGVVATTPQQPSVPGGPTTGTPKTGTTSTATPPAGPKEETIEIKAPAQVSVPPPAAPSWQTKPLTSQDVEPSGESQVVSYEDKVSVRIPGNALKEPQKLTISAVTDAPASATGEQPLAVYDISFEKQHEFNSDLEFTFAYDAADVPEGMAPESALGVSAWDEGSGTWAPMQFSADTARQTLSVAANHNGLWEVYRQSWTGQLALITDHFIVYFKTDDFKSAKLTRYWELEKQWPAVQAGTIKRTPAETQEWVSLKTDPSVSRIIPQGTYDGKLKVEDRHYYDENPGVPYFIVDVAYYAEKAYDIYSEKFGKTPYLSSVRVQTSEPADLGGGTTGAIKTLPVPSTDTTWAMFTRFPIYVDEDYRDPRYMSRSRSIGIGFTDLGRLQESISHELFHAIQNKDYYLALRQTRVAWWADWLGFRTEELWWIESTATYAANKIAVGSARPAIFDLNSYYFAEDFFSNGNPDLNHPYKNAYFIDFLAGAPESFPAIYNQVAGISDTRKALDDYVKASMAGKVGLYDCYREWATNTIFDEKSAYKDALFTLERPPDMVVQNLKVEHGRGLTFAWAGIRPAVTGDSGKRKLTVDLQSVYPTELPGYCRIDLYKLKDNERALANLELIGTWDIQKDTCPKEIGTVELNAGDGLYILITKYNELSTQFLLNVRDEASVHLICPEVPADGKGTMGEQYSFQRKGFAMPDSAAFTWLVDGKGLDKGGDLLTLRFWDAGQHTVQARAAWEPQNTAESNICSITMGNPVIALKSPVAPGEKALVGTSYTFTQESKYIPGGAEYWWYVNDKEVEGNERGAAYIFQEPGVYIVRVRAEWPVPQGKPGSVEASATVTTQTGFQVAAAPTPGMAGQPSEFSISGQGIPENAGFTWDFGQQEGGLSTGSPVAKPTHTYKDAGTYNVTATAVDRTSGKSLGKAALTYVVNAQPYVKIEPRPSAAKPGDKINLAAKLYGMPDKLSLAPQYAWTISRDNIEIASPNGETLPYTFDKAGRWTMKIIVQARDKDNGWVKGREGDNWLTDSITIVVEAGPTVAISLPADLQSNKGMVDNDYTFTVLKTGIPDTGVEYIWYMDGEARYKGASIMGAFHTAKDYVMKVEARWTENGQARSLTSPEVRFSIGQVVTLALMMPASGGPESRFVFNTQHNVPRGAVFSWFINGQKKMEVVNGDRLNADPNYFQPGTYSISVVAKWTDLSGKEQSMSDGGAFTVLAAAQPPSTPTPAPTSTSPVTGGTSSITLRMPSGTQGRAVEYTFTAEPSNIPGNARYYWWVDEDMVGQASYLGNCRVVNANGVHQMTTPSNIFYSNRSYVISVKAVWLDSNNQDQSAEAARRFDVK